jgi:hypothetical protein
MNIYLITFDFKISQEYGIGNCIVVAESQERAELIAMATSHAKWFPIASVKKLDANDYTNSALIADLVFIG